MLPPSAWTITDHLMETAAAPSASARIARASSPQRRFHRRRKVAFA